MEFARDESKRFCDHVCDILTNTDYSLKDRSALDDCMSVMVTDISVTSEDRPGTDNQNRDFDFKIFR